MDLKAIAKTQKPIPLDTKQNIFKWNLVPDLSMTLKILENGISYYKSAWQLHGFYIPCFYQKICKQFQILLLQTNRMMTLNNNDFKTKDCKMFKMCIILGRLIKQFLSRN